MPIRIIAMIVVAITVFGCGRSDESVLNDEIREILVARMSPRHITVRDTDFIEIEIWNKSLSRSDLEALASFQQAIISLRECDIDEDDLSVLTPVEFLSLDLRGTAISGRFIHSFSGQNIPRLLVDSVDRQYVKDIRTLVGLKYLAIDRSSLGDEDVKQLINGGHLGGLRELSLKDNNLSRIEPLQLHTLQFLNKLDLSGNPIRTINRGEMDGVADKYIYLHRTEVGDKSSEAFCSLGNLRAIGLIDSNVTIEGLDSIVSCERKSSFTVYVSDRLYELVRESSRDNILKHLSTDHHYVFN